MDRGRKMVTFRVFAEIVQFDDFAADKEVDTPALRTPWTTSFAELRPDDAFTRTIPPWPKNGVTTINEKTSAGNFPEEVFQSHEKRLIHPFPQALQPTEEL